MRGYAVIAVLTFAPGLWPAGNQLTWEDRVELTRGLTAEYATVKVLLPRSSKPLVFDAKNGYDKNQWMEVGRQSGPAARTGDLVQVTKIDIGDDKLVLQINGGFKGGRKWYQGVQIGMGGGNTAPISNNTNDTNAPGGTSIAVPWTRTGRCSTRTIPRGGNHRNRRSIGRWFPEAGPPFPSWQETKTFHRSFRPP